MTRLTERDEFGNSDIIGVECAELQFNLEFDEMNLVTEALNKLAAYEGTGLTPDDINELNDFEQSQCAKLLAENGKLKAKLKMAIDDISSGNANDCDTCLHGADHDSDCPIEKETGGCSYKWRGEGEDEKGNHNELGTLK
jgi:hypothetical protein